MNERSGKQKREISAVAQIRNLAVRVAAEKKAEARFATDWACVLPLSHPQTPALALAAVTHEAAKLREELGALTAPTTVQGALLARTLALAKQRLTGKRQ